MTHGFSRTLPRVGLVLALLASSVALAAPTKGAPGRRAARPRPTGKAVAKPATGGARSAAGPETERPRYYLSWHAPAGMPGATDTAVPSCEDSLQIDTLWVSFEVTRDESTFIGLGGEITITPEQGDSLGAYWRTGGTGKDHSGLYMEMGDVEGAPGEIPWDYSGMGGADFECVAERGYYRFFYVVPEAHGVPLYAGHRYTAGRLLVRNKRRDLSGCEKPVCINWGIAEFGFEIGRSVRVYSGGAHVVSRGEGANPCRLRPAYWRPGRFGGTGAGAGAPADSSAHH